MSTRARIGLLLYATTRAAAFSCTTAGHSGVLPLRCSRAGALVQRKAQTLTMANAAAVGDLASVKWAVTLADGKPLPQQGQVFDQGDVRMVVGAGGFLPCLHKKVAGMSVGDKASVDVLPADAFGESNPMMGPVDIPAAQAPAGLEAGMLVQLATGQKARVTQVTADAVTIDANMPLAGAALKMDVELLAVEAGAASLEKADFALGCFWGAELAFQREKGVVSTKVGYTQGAKESPTYEEVCSGKTRARARTQHACTHARTRTRTHVTYTSHLGRVWH